MVAWTENKVSQFVCNALRWVKPPSDISTYEVNNKGFQKHEHIHYVKLC